MAKTGYSSIYVTISNKKPDSYARPHGPGKIARALTTLLLGLIVLNAPNPRAADEVSPMASLDNDKTLQPGDIVDFRVIEDRDPTRVLGILPTGEIVFPYVGKVIAKGKTCQVLALEVKKLLEQDYYYKATVLLSFHYAGLNQGEVLVVGQVAHEGPVKLPINERFTVSKAIIAAGGFVKFASKSGVKVIRRTGPNPKDKEEIKVDVAAVLEHGRLEKDLEVLPGDMIIVPQRWINF